MEKTEKNKQFMLNYYRDMLEAIREGPEAVEVAMALYIKDQELIEHIRFFVKSFPGYRLVIEYLLAEDDQVFVKATFVWKHKGDSADIPESGQEVKTPFALVYTIEDEMITKFWAIANEMEFFEQLGMTREQVEVRKEEYTQSS
jgi:hypothetical protein